jgi:broad specificity phosphatase PhoE
MHGRWVGQADLPLTITGHGQAVCLGRRLRQERPTAAYTSDLLRARRTAEIALPGLGLAAVVEPDLREVHLGAWEGLTVDEIASLYADVYARMRHSPFDFLPPGGESTAALIERVRRAVDRIAAGHNGETVAVFTHGGALRAIAYVITGSTASWHGPVHNAGLSIVEWDGDERRILLWDDRSHLEQESPPAGAQGQRAAA